jgi:4-carboxymuconolactone decarboxylase
MEEERGYILDFHKVMAEEDFDFLQGYNALLEAAYTKPRLLDPKTKELIFTAVLMAVRSQPDHLKTHMEMAKRYGATKQEVLEVLEMTLPPTGVPAFMHAYAIWREVFGV